MNSVVSPIYPKSMAEAYGIRSRLRIDVHQIESDLGAFGKTRPEWREHACEALRIKKEQLLYVRAWIDEHSLRSNPHVSLYGAVGKFLKLQDEESFDELEHAFGIITAARKEEAVQRSIKLEKSLRGVETNG